MNQTPAFKTSKATLIDVSELKEVNYWSDRLGIKPEVLKAAVRASKSVSVDKIVDYLKSIKKINTDYIY